MKFREWLILQEAQHIISTRTDLLGKPFFYFAGMPVTEIDFRFEYQGKGMNRLNSSKGARFLTKLPKSIRILTENPQSGEHERIRDIPIEPAGGNYIVVNSVYDAIFQGKVPSLVTITNRPLKAMKEQKMKELQARVRTEHPEWSPGEVQRNVVLPSHMGDEYTLLPPDWLNYTIIGFQRTPSFSGAVSLPMKHIDLYAAQAPDHALSAVG